MKTYVLGDVHGGAKALQQVFERSPFNPKEDRLICIGDFCDGWSGIPEAFDMILDIPNLVYLWGNHDMWAFQGFYQPGFMETKAAKLWTSQGGRSTIDAYGRVGEDKRDEHINQFLAEKALNYLVDDGNAYMHAGFNLSEKLEDQSYLDEYFWNRDLFYAMHESRDIEIKTDHDIDKIFVGHTPTLNHMGRTKPIKFQTNDLKTYIYFIDTGACYSGPLTLMDVETEEYWQSDPVMELYPNQKGRNRFAYNSPNNPNNN